ncbi:MAG: hypothetical protein JWQ09_2773 [Segetibacter sp.]|nr:hypothetical protein [Segetibacter sp.]
MKYLPVLFFLAISVVTSKSNAAGKDTIIVRNTLDFTFTGDGESEQWKTTQRNVIPQRRDSLNKKETRFKTLYSDKGIYFLFSNEDAVLTASERSDFDSLWLEDVNEVFLWPDTSNTIYFEYEISPLNYELPILVPNINGKFLGWRPWLYANDRKTRHFTKIVGGNKQKGSGIKSWTSEFFIPYALLAPLQNVPPKHGSVWRANMYRVDYDYNRTAVWSWQKTETNFHQFEKFGKLIFE